MAAEISEINNKDIDSAFPPKSTVRSPMSKDNLPSAAGPASSVTGSGQKTPPPRSLLERHAAVETFMTPSPSAASSSSSLNKGGVRQFNGVEGDFYEVAKSPLSRVGAYQSKGASSFGENSFVHDLSSRMSSMGLAYSEASASAPVTPPMSQTHYDPRSRGNTINELTPPLPAGQFDFRPTQRPMLTPPNEDIFAATYRTASQSTPVSRRNSNSEAMRMAGKDLSVIYEDGKASQSGSSSSFGNTRTKSSSSRLSLAADAPVFAPTFGDNTKPFFSSDVNSLSIDDPTAQTKSILQMNTTDDKFPILTSLSGKLVDPESSFNSLDRALPLPTSLPRGRHGSTPSWPSAPSLPSRNHASRSSYPEPRGSRYVDFKDIPVEYIDPIESTARMSAGSSSRNISTRTTPDIPGLHFDSQSRQASLSSGFGGCMGNDIGHRDMSVVASQLRQSPPQLAGLSTDDYRSTNSHGSFAHYGSIMNHELPGHPGSSFYGSPHPKPHEQQYGSLGRGRKFYSRHSNFESNVPAKLEDIVGDILNLCKDQNGCRYLQKKLDEDNSVYTDLIFTETRLEFTNLMTDPFGNYLCQKLLEKCNTNQRNQLVRVVCADIVSVSLNMHGTRAVQKMLDLMDTHEQIEMVIEALRADVIRLVKDLNGNHVIQKCLNKLDAHSKQFVYDAIAQNCVEVATHRHGTCVLQRCVDHADGKQKEQLIAQLHHHAFQLAQDQFGNYAIQYVLNLEDKDYNDLLIKRFRGNVVSLATQKFGSNVIEKCIRLAEQQVRKELIHEMLNRQSMEKLIKDQYANYVVQTALDCAEEDQKERMVQLVKPLLNSIRHENWHRRLVGKISGGSATNVGGPQLGYRGMGNGFGNSGYSHMSHAPSPPLTARNFYTHQSHQPNYYQTAPYAVHSNYHHLNYHEDHQQQGSTGTDGYHGEGEYQGQGRFF